MSCILYETGVDRTLSGDATEGCLTLTGGPVVPFVIAILWFDEGSKLCKLKQDHDHFFPPFTFSPGLLTRV